MKFHNSGKLSGRNFAFFQIFAKLVMPIISPVNPLFERIQHAMLNVVTPITFYARISHFFDNFPRIMEISRLNPPFQGGSSGIQHVISGEM